jgi:hypothetical protein
MFSAKRRGADMAQYAVYETQRIMVVYYVEADNVEEAYDLVATMDVDDYDDRICIMDTDIDKSETRIEARPGIWEMVEE